MKKKFSQNFLLDENIIQNIVKSAEIDELSYVIEVGPGLGALTKHLVKIAKKVLVYEIDSDLVEVLKELFLEKDNLNIIEKDFLKAKLDEDIDKYLDGSEKVVFISNLPYHITTPIVMKVLEESKKVKSMTLMMQLEVAKRLTSKPNSKDYNALSIIIQDQTEAKYLFKVSKSVFKPRPNVDSAVIKLDRTKVIIADENKRFYDFLHKAFAQRRKTLVNNLSEGYHEWTKEEIKGLLKNMNIDENIRGEALSLTEFKDIFNSFKKKGEII